MLSFKVFNDDKPARHWPLRNAYLIGADGNPMRSQITFENGLILCEKREAGSAALTLQYDLGELGELSLQTCLLCERDEAYLLSLELARHRLMVLYNKLEDWGMFDLPEDHTVIQRTRTAREKFLESLSLQGEDAVGADRLAYEALSAALDGTEELALAHSELLLNKRKVSAALPRRPFGCGIDLVQTHEGLRKGLHENFDFVHLPTPWKVLAPQEAEYRWDAMDRWVEWAKQQDMPIIAGPIISFEPRNLPDWLYIWEHDYDTVRDLIYEHVERVVTRYRDSIDTWIVCSGLHVNSHFTFNFEQLMDLTRMTCMEVRKLHPTARTFIEVRQPFGEYYSTNPRSIPPLMYVDLILQSGIGFDGFAVKLIMGQAQPGQYTRDLMQISGLMDLWQGIEKPLYVTVGAPSAPVTEMMIAVPETGEPVDAASGHWRRPWSQVVQGHWLQAVMQIAMSKPCIDAVAWQELADHPQIELPLSGLVTESLEPKEAFKRLVSLRKQLSLSAVAPQTS